MHIYFLAIGGAGIAPLAQIASQAGYQVSGSDKQNTNYVDYLREHGVSDITITDSESAISEAHAQKPIDWVVYSSAVAMEESGERQLVAVQELGVKCTKRDEFISEFVKQKNLKMIGVAGTHGKTTTTAMLTWLFTSLDIPVSYLVPAKISFGDMAKYTADSEYFIYEADEYDHNFLAFSPRISVISGVSWDHHEIYPTKEEYIEAFRKYINQSAKTIIWSKDQEYLDVSGDKLIVENEDNDSINDITLKGLYNRRDAWVAVVAASQVVDTPFDKLIDQVNSFPGLSRRMEEISPGLFSDYAHTPDKIRGAISVASEIAKDRKQGLIVIYEPLTNRRQIHIINDYQDCFDGADHVYWLPSYLAREDPGDRIIEPSELVAKLSNPEIAEPMSRDEHLVELIRDHLDMGNIVVGMAGGGGGSLDDWLRENFKSDH